jgi:cellulose synthase/poly-beta-1,6-N-acetylglucosamine synthase-like glycosyltransferase
MMQSRNPPPQAFVNRSVLRGWDYPAFAILTALQLAFVAWALGHWFAWAGALEHPASFVVLTTLLVLGVGLFEGRWLCLLLMRRPDQVPPRNGWSVGVAVTFVPDVEDVEMLEETVAALLAMDYPHDTWVLDEGDSEEVRDLCRRLGAHHFSRKGRPSYQRPSGAFAAATKHGNYNAWLYEMGFARYDLIVGFDPDHVPARGFLRRVLGYFEDPSVGYVQAPQAYYNQGASFIARGAAEETYAYYSSVQMAAYATGYPIVTGCHNAHRARALREVGGFAPHDGDDLLITLHYRAAGWRGVYVPEILARGITPVDWLGYLRQQRRWARSVLDIKLRIFPRLAGELPWRERLASLIHGLYYLQGLGTALGIAVIILLDLTWSPGVLTEVPKVLLMLGVLGLCDLYRQRFFLEPSRERGLHLRSAVLRLAKWPHILAALFDVVFPRKRAYAVTPKARRPSLSRTALAVPHGSVACAVGLAWGVGVLAGNLDNAVLHLANAGIVISSLALVASERLRFPPPFDPRLAQEALETFRIRSQEPACDP